MLTEPVGENLWRALVRPGRKVAIGESLVFPAPTGEIALEAEVLERGEFGERLLRFTPVDDFFAVLDRIGHMPLPPYIRRDDVTRIASATRPSSRTSAARWPRPPPACTSRRRFSTRWPLGRRNRAHHAARRPRHLCPAARGASRTRSACTASATRSPLQPPTPSTAPSAKAGASSPSAPRWYARWNIARFRLPAQPLKPHSGETEIFISPGFDFRLVSALLTNFHLPQSSLLMLVSAFAGREQVLAAYRHAVEQKYRFFSYGDCMFIA